MKKNNKGLLRNEEAQLGIDFVVGFSIFLLALSFVVVTISGMFLPFQTEVIDTNSVSYRTSVILVEDPGYWSNGANGGEDWENHIDNVSRIGLAVDKESPNVLGIDKLSAFKDETQIDDKKLSKKLGLYRIIGDSKVYYGYNIVLTSLDGEVLALRGSEIPEYGDVSSMKRIVNAQTDSVYIIEKLKGTPGPESKGLFDITNPQEDIMMVIKGWVVRKEGSPDLKLINLDKKGLSLGTDYWVWIKSGTDGFILQSASLPSENPKSPDIPLPDVPYNTTAELKIKISKNALHSGVNEIEINFDHITIEKGRVNLDDLEKAIISEPAILNVNIWN